MFDIGFWEIALIGVIALLVVGPERLPGLARTVGLWVGRVRRYVSHVKQDIERELHADEMRELLEKREGLSELKDVAEETASVFKDARSGLDEAARSVAEPEASVAAAEPAEAPQRTVPHHAVDEDPFAPQSLDGVTPAQTEENKAPASTPVEPDNEPQPERPGQH